MEQEQFLRRLDCLVQDIESCTEPALRERLRGVVEILLDFHHRGLANMMRHLAESPGGPATIEAVVRDDLVASLLLLHDLHPSDLKTRVSQAIERHAGRWASLRGRVRLLDVTPDGVVKLRWVPRGQGPAANPTELRSSIEPVIYAAAPDATAVEIEGLAERSPHGFVALSGIRILRGGKSAFANDDKADV